MARLGRGIPTRHMYGLALYTPVVAFDATGAGYTTTTTASSVSASWSHTAVAGAAVVVATALMSNNSGSYSSFTRSATYGGATMTSLGVVNFNNQTQGWIELFGILGVLPGTKTVTWSVTGGSPTFYCAAADSVSYLNVASFGTTVTNPAQSTSMSSGSVTSASGQMVAQAFSSSSTIGAITISGYNQTSRYAQNIVNGADGLAFVQGDAPGASSVTFSATDSVNAYYGSVAVPLVPSKAIAITQ